MEFKIKSGGILYTFECKYHYQKLIDNNLKHTKRKLW